jgi:hypothetical protein
MMNEQSGRAVQFFCKLLFISREKAAIRLGIERETAIALKLCIICQIC